ncbi:family 2 glycosyl transferase [Intrasporangium oryzae NRRL B-24470]|uniref:Family 2 glycosyl transferase n=1 Tax=Intrasporangium oryzae NRRL B-24470 TaxID=1386089 RepID=W9G5D7_9MICO|nr:family 2 glycosyl transferase [Intrasporangium oryzae NRRL B-24470]
MQVAAGSDALTDNPAENLTEELTEERGRPGPAAGAAASGPLGTPPRPAPSVPVVDAVLVVRNGSPWLAQCLDGIAAQTLPPSRLVIVDLASTDTSGAIARAHQSVRQAVDDVRLVRLDEPVPLGRAIDLAVASLPEPADPRTAWVWVLHDDSAARPTALARMLDAVRRSPSVGVAGPKLVEWDDPRRLRELGIQITRTGRHIAAPTVGEADQGQYDGRTDVLAVSTSGMLVRRDVHSDLHGFDPTFATYGTGLDFGWRAQLAGHRVIVVPGAVVRDAAADDTGARDGGPGAREVERRSRRAGRQVVLARSSPLAAPFLAVWMALSAVLSALVLLVAKRPRQAWRELADIGALAHPFATLAARWRGRRSRRLRRSHLATLFVRPTHAARTTVDHIQDAVAPDGGRRRREASPTTETGPVAEEAEGLESLPHSVVRRVLSHPGFLAVLAVLVTTVVAWRDPIRAGALVPSNTGLAGGELRAVTTGSSGLWHAFRDAWHGAGLGSGTEAGPYLAVLAGLTWLAERVPGVASSRSSAGVTVAWLLFLAPALSSWTAYLAGRVVTSSRTARALVAAAWGTSAVLTAGLVEGRLTIAVAHVLLPLVLAGFTLAAQRDGTWTATFATALVTAVLAAFVPPLLAVSSVAAVLLVLLGPGARRLRGLVLLIVPLGLLGPWVSRVVEDARVVLSGPGIVSTAPGAPWWAVLLGRPEGTPDRFAWLIAPALALGLAGYAARSRSRSESVGLAAAGMLCLLGLAASFASGRVVLGSAETGVGQSAPAHLWAGVGSQLWVAGLLVGLLAGSRHVVALFARPLRRWPVAAGTLVVLLVVVPVAAGAVRWGANGMGDSLSVARATVPAVAVEQATGPLGNRLLVLRPSDRVVDFVLAGEEPGEVLRDLDRGSAVDETALVAAVARLVGGRGADALDTSELARLGIGFVRARSDADSALTRRLDSTEGLSRLGASPEGILWKVRPLPAAAGISSAAPAPSRVRLVDGRGALLGAVETSGPHAAVDTDVPSGPAGRRLVAAEPVEWSGQARVTLDGTPLDPVAGAAQPTFVLPAQGGHLVVDLAAAHPWWRLGQALLLAFVVFMALPFGNRRSRRRA